LTGDCKNLQLGIRLFIFHANDSSPAYDAQVAPLGLVRENQLDLGHLAERWAGASGDKDATDADVPAITNLKSFSVFSIPPDQDRQG
jgi:hypothetical protein